MYHRYVEALRWIVLSLFLITAGSVHAEIYKWVDESGRMHFSDQPPLVDKAETIELPEISTYSQAKISDKEVDLEMAENSSAPGNSKQVVMYTATWCGICKNAKRYFRKHKISFQEYDIENSKKGRRDFKKLKARGVPVILVGKKRLNGFDPKKFEALYKS